MMRLVLMVGAGGAVGAMLRYGVTLLFQALSWSNNLATLCVNVIGSFLMGLLTAHCQQSAVLLMLTTGLLGGFTTFSTFSLQTVTLFQQGRPGHALLYAAGTATACILVAWLGYSYLRE